MKKAENLFYDVVYTIRKCRLLAASMVMMMAWSACSDDESPEPTPVWNDACMLTDKDKLAMVHSLVDLEGDKGRIYEMTYDVDYRLDDALNFEIHDLASLKAFVARYLMDTIPAPRSVSLSYSSGCSAFACPNKASGDYLMGRNFDFNHIDPVTKERTMIPVIAVHTAPAGGKKSVSFVDGAFMDYEQGFFKDGKSDLSMLMALPYVLLDGINEDGFAVSVLKLDGLNAEQTVEGRKKIFTTVAMRMLLDKASTVNEATELLEQYNMNMDKDSASYHFFMADATGDYAIVEYTNQHLDQHPNNMEVLRGNDTLRYVTNFYVSPTMQNTKLGGGSKHGRDRYNILKNSLYEYNYIANPTQAMGILHSVAQGPEDSQLSTGFTQWSEIYNLSKKTVTMSILREYGQTFEFDVD